MHTDPTHKYPAFLLVGAIVTYTIASVMQQTYMPADPASRQQAYMCAVSVPLVRMSDGKNV